MLKTVALPLALVLIMLGMGMTLTLNDFKRVIRKPLGSFLGLTNQLLILPLIAFGLCWIFKLERELAVGLMLISACPGGPTSNMISHLCKGDTALSVTLTAFSTLITIVTIPFIVRISMAFFMDSHADMDLPFSNTVLKLLLVTLVPGAIGMVIHHHFPKFAYKMSGPIRILSLIILALVIIVAVTREDELGKYFRMAGPAAVSLNLLGMLSGFFSAKLAGLGLRQQITLSIECGIQNGTLALAIALGMMNLPHVAIPAVVYSLLMYISGAGLILIFGTRPRGSDPL